MIVRKVKMGLGLAAMAVVVAGCGTPMAVRGDTASPSAAHSPTASPSPSAEASPAAVVSTAPAIRPAPPAASPPAPPAPRPLAPAPAPPAAAPEYPTAGRACEEELEHVDELGALGTDCETARRVAAAVDTKVLLLGAVPLEPFMAVDGWICSKDRGELEEFVYIECNRGDSRMESVTFGWGT